jgi:TRAP-type C4-dicarboxylate transport system permease small subunit
MGVLAGLINALDWVNLKILWFCRYLTIALVAIIAVNVFVGVFWRYVLDDSLPWYEESSKYMMLWMVFVACPIVLKQRGHIALDYLPNKLPGRLKNLNYLIIYTFVLALVCVFGWHGSGLAWIARNQTPTSIDVSFAYVYAAIPFGSGVMALISFEFWLRALRGIFRPEETDLDAGDMMDSTLS